MRILNEQDINYRHGDHGPKYFLQGPRCNFGVCRLRPGDVAEEHYHSHMEEDFYMLEGESDFIIDGERHTCRTGDFIHMEPGERHRVENNSGAPSLYIVHTTPYIEGGDKTVTEK